MAVGMAGTTMARTAKRAVGDVGPAVRMPQRSFGAVTHDMLGLIEQAIARIEHGEGAEAALREMGLLSSRSKPWSSATLASGWPPTTCTRLPRRLSRARAPDQIWWTSGGGGCSRKRVSACVPG